MRHTFWIALLMVPALAIAIGFAEDDDMGEDALAKAIVVHFHAKGNPASKDAETRLLAPARRDYEERAVLFVTVDVTTRASKNQAKLLLNALGLGDAYRAHAGKPGSVVVVDASLGEVVKTFTGKSDLKSLKSAVDDLLAEDEEMEEDVEGCG